MEEIFIIDRVAGCLSKFHVGRYRFMLRLTEPAYLDCYLGNVLHGLLKTSLFNTTCDRLTGNDVADKESHDLAGRAQNGAYSDGWKTPYAELCTDCHRILKKECAYGYCMETIALTGRPDGSANHPHPYVLEPPPARRPSQWESRRSTRYISRAGNDYGKWGCGLYRYEIGESIPFNLILVGKGIDFRDDFINAVREGGERAGIGIHAETCKMGRPKFILDTRSMDAVRARGRFKVKGDGFGELITFDDLVAELHHGLPCRLELRFVTPTHIQAGGGRYTNRFDFKIFMMRLLGRIRDLSVHHCNQEFDYDFLLPGIEKVKTTYCEFEEHEWPRKSSRHGKMTHWGITGRMVFEGRLAPYIPFIRLGEYIHVGNMTSFGWGQYEICAMD